MSGIDALSKLGHRIFCISGLVFGEIRPIDHKESLGVCRADLEEVSVVRIVSLIAYLTGICVRALTK
jgi:hypothetical protein